MGTPSKTTGVQIRMYDALWQGGQQELKLKGSSRQKSILIAESAYKGRGGLV